jgi:hypothetical protein
MPAPMNRFQFGFHLIEIIWNMQRVICIKAAKGNKPCALSSITSAFSISSLKALNSASLYTR